MFAKHLPPSAGRPRVLALDESSAAELPEAIELTRGGPETPGEFDTVVGYAAPDRLADLFARLRPGGRLILAARTNPNRPGQARRLLDTLASAGFIHCFVEAAGEYILYRGERPPQGLSVERLSSLAHSPLPEGEGQGVRVSSPFIFLLITQTPRKPAWEFAPDEKLEWRAATAIDPATRQTVLLAFTSLVKAVAFMQSAILAQWIGGVNKVGKFRAETARAWALSLILNPKFDDLRSAAPGPTYEVDPQTAITGEE